MGVHQLGSILSYIVFSRVYWKSLFPYPSSFMLGNLSKTRKKKKKLSWWERRNTILIKKKKILSRKLLLDFFQFLLRKENRSSFALGFFHCQTMDGGF